MRFRINLLRRYGIPLLAFILGLSLRPFFMDTPLGPDITGQYSQHHMREKDPLDLLIFVVSAPGNSERREAIRTTWLSHQHNDIRGYFVIGTLGLSPDLMSSLGRC